MRISYDETIELIPKTKNTGIVLIKNNSPQYYLDSLNKFFGGFGRNLVIGGNDEYLLFLFVPEKFNKLDSCSYYERENEFLFLEGTFYDNEFHMKNNDIKIDTRIAKRLFDEVKAKHDYNLLKKLNGHYSGVAFIHNCLIAFTDMFGVNKLFYYNEKEKFIISNNLFSIINNKKLNIEIDDEAVAQILTIEFPLERKTGFKGVNYILPSDILLKSNNNIKFLKEYISFYRSDVKDKKAHLNELHDTIEDFFLRIKKVIDEPLNLFLSKGKDCRLFIEFLEKNNISYNLYAFAQNSGIFDFPYAIEIAKALDKDIHLLEYYKIDELTEIITSMSTTVTSPWLALAYTIKKNQYNYGLIGTDGDRHSGSLTCFEDFPVKNQNHLFQKEYDHYRKGVPSVDLNSIIPSFSKFDVKDSFFEAFGKYNESTLYDIEILFNNDYRCFKNTRPILNKATHFITPIHPYLDKKVSQKYFSLPVELIKSRKAHVILSAMNAKSNKIKSTIVPVSLRREIYFREIIMIGLHINSVLKGKLIAKNFNKISPVHNSSEFSAKSFYFSDLFNNLPVECKNNRLLSRLKNVDKFIKNTYETPIDKICHGIDTVKVIGKNKSCNKFLKEYLSVNERYNG